MKKVLLVAWKSLRKGGIQSVLMNIVRTLHSEFTFDVLLFSSERGFYEKEILSYGGKIFRIPQYEGSNTFLKRADIYTRQSKLFSKTKKIIEKNGPYVAIHCNNGFESGVFLKAAYQEEVPVRIVHSHSVIDDRGFLRETYNRHYGKLIEKYATHCIACSDQAGKSLFGRNYFKTINNPYDENKYQRVSPISDVNDTLTLCQVGRLCEIKNQLFTLQVVEALKKSNPKIKIRFVGANYNGYKEKMERFISDHDLTSNVEFYDENADIPNLYKNTTFVIFPSETEGFGIVPIEAQAMGIKCFVSDRVPKITDCGGCVYLKLGDADLWSECIDRAFQRKDSIRVNYNCSRFSMRTIGNQYKKIYLAAENGDKRL